MGCKKTCVYRACVVSRGREGDISGFDAGGKVHQTSKQSCIIDVVISRMIKSQARTLHGYRQKGDANSPMEKWKIWGPA